LFYNRGIESYTNCARGGRERIERNSVVKTMVNLHLETISEQKEKGYEEFRKSRTVYYREGRREGGVSEEIALLRNKWTSS